MSKNTNILKIIFWAKIWVYLLKVPQTCENTVCEISQLHIMPNLNVDCTFSIRICFDVQNVLCCKCVTKLFIQKYDFEKNAHIYSVSPILTVHFVILRCLFRTNEASDGSRTCLYGWGLWNRCQNGNNSKIIFLPKNEIF